MSATSKTTWFWSDWLGDEAVRRLTPAERGVWIDLLALAASGHPKGYVCDGNGRPLTLDEIARVTNAGSPDEVVEHIANILKKGAGSRDRTGRLFNRRMVRDTELQAKRSRAGRKGGDHTNLINKRNKALLQHLPQHLLQQNKTGPPRPYLKKERKTSFSAARASGEAVDNSVNSEPAEPKRSAEVRKPNEVSKSELEAMFAAKRINAP